MNSSTNKTETYSVILAEAHFDYAKGLNIYAFLKVGSHGLGEDLVQKAFTKTWSYLVAGGRVDLMRAFLYHILNALIIDEYRKRKALSLDALLEKGFEVSHNPTSNLLNKLDGKLAMQLIEQLPEPYKKIMMLRYKHELTTAEICIITGRTKNAIAVQAHRGLEKLRILYTKGEIVI
jgi:RNA polymerase sigma-70 factor (ECF subfamily)